MRKLIALSLLTINILNVCPAYADDITLPPPPPLQPGEQPIGAVLSPMKKGQVAPFTGVLLSPRATATIVTQLNSVPEQIKIEVDKAVSVERSTCNFKMTQAEIRCNADKAILQAQVDENIKRINILNEELKKAEDSRPNTTLIAVLGVSAGIVVGVGITALSAYIVGQSSK